MQARCWYSQRSRSKCRKTSCRLGASRPIENFDPNLAAFPLDGTVGTKLSVIRVRSNLPARARSCSMRRGGLCDVGFGRTLVIATNNLVNRSYCNQTALFQENCPVAHRFDQRIRVTGEYENARALDQRLHAGLGARRKSCIPGAQPFVEQQNVWLDCSCNRKAEARNHAGRVGSNWEVEVFTQFTEIDDVEKLAVDLLGTHPEKHAARLDVFVAVVVGVEAGCGVEQRGNSAFDADGARVRRVHPGNDFQ